MSISSFVPSHVKAKLWEAVTGKAEQIASRLGLSQVLKFIDIWAKDTTLRDSFFIAVERGIARFGDEYRLHSVEIAERVSSEADLFFQRRHIGKLVDTSYKSGIVLSRCAACSHKSSAIDLGERGHKHSGTECSCGNTWMHGPRAVVTSWYRGY